MLDNHLFATDIESATDGKLEEDIPSWEVDAKDLLLDLKVLIKEYYIATLNSQSNSLLLKFTNGQKFSIVVKEL